MINGLMHDHIAKFMSKHRLPAGLRLFVVRSDGLLVWDGKPDAQSQALAALCSGVWEAAKAMAQAGGQLKLDEFRFVFDSTDKGVVIFPVKGEGQPFFLSAIYDGCVNPALLKRQVQVLGEKLSTHIASLPRQVRSPQQSQRQGFLFTDISDDEMDRLFGV